MNFGDPRLPERFWSKCVPEPNSGCWLWFGACDAKGYGRYWHKGKARWAHRVVKRFRRTAHHTCYTPCCVNPDHLQDVSRAKNSSFGHAEYAQWRKYQSYVENHDAVPF